MKSQTVCCLKAYLVALVALQLNENSTVRKSDIMNKSHWENFDNHPRLLPVCVPVSLLQHLDDLRQQVSGVSGAQQVQQHLLTVFITDDLVQRRQDLLHRWETGETRFF